MTDPPAWDADRELWQEVRNAQPIPARRAQVTAPVAIPVTARVVWERDGVEERETVAWAWTSRSVLVRLQDRRWQTIGVWLPVGDVRRLRRASPSGPGNGRSAEASS